jgi:hypothetical protein
MSTDTDKPYCDCKYTANVSSRFVQRILTAVYAVLTWLAIRPCQVGLARWRKVSVVHEHVKPTIVDNSLQRFNESNKETEVTFEQIFCSRCGIVECRNMQIGQKTPT